MTIGLNDWIAAVAIVATDGNIEIVSRDPFSAKTAGPGGPITMQTFLFEPAGIAVLELFVPVARVEASARLDSWIARATPKLFNVYVSARDIENLTFVEVRSSMVADGMTVEVLGRVLALLAAGAGFVAQELRGMVDSPAHPATSRPLISDPVRASTAEIAPASGQATPVAFAGYI